jgi:CTP synthase (UTP-ammonia lyase)
LIRERLDGQELIELERAVRPEIRIGLIGDYNPSVRAHTAIPRALELAAEAQNCDVRTAWSHTGSLGNELAEQFAACHGLWCVPASPYANMDGALRAIRFARENSRPFLGTCGGFQHAVIEYARNVLGFGEADHAESNPKAVMPLIAPLSCSLIGVRGKIRLQPGSQAARIYDRAETTEEYHCNFGVNRQHQRLFEPGHLKITGVDEAGETRVVELEGHPFFMATLFQPELSALNGAPHPLVAAFLMAARTTLNLRGGRISKPVCS